MKLKIYFASILTENSTIVGIKPPIRRTGKGKNIFLEEGDRDWTLRWLETDSQGGQNFSRAGALIIAKLPK